MNHCEKHDVWHGGQCADCIREQTRQLGALCNTQQLAQQYPGIAQWLPEKEKPVEEKNAVWDKPDIYGEGQEARVGDVVKHPGNFTVGRAPAEATVTAIKYGRLRTSDLSEYEQRVDPYPFRVGDCILIRRAGESEPRPRDFGSVPDGMHEWLCPCGQYSRRDAAPIEEAECTECGRRLVPKEDPRVVLGHDRNGREVRRGDRVRCFDNPEFFLVAGSLSPETPLFEACFHDVNGGRHILQKAAELVDEKAEPTPACLCACHGHKFFGVDHSTPCCDRMGERHSAAPCPARYKNYATGPECDGKHENGRHGFDDRAAPGGRVEWWDTTVGDAIESALRALSGPTMAERFERFKERVDRLMKPAPFIKYHFDCDAKHGPIVRLLTPHEKDRPGDMDWVGFTEHATDEHIDDRLDRWAGELGWDVLAGRRILGGGK